MSTSRGGKGRVGPIPYGEADFLGNRSDPPQPSPLRRDGYELVRSAPQPYNLVAHLYRRIPTPPPADPWANAEEVQPWQQAELPAGLETVSERVQAMPAEVRARFAELTPEQRACLGYPDDPS